MTKTDGETYEETLARLQLALVETQVKAIDEGWKILVVLEGRDAAGKDGTIRRIVEHLSARNTRVVALPKPSDRERSSWFLQRYVAQLPAGGEFVVFNRSWYNRAGVERVMGFSTPAEQETFLRDAPVFESMLVENGIKLVKYWLDISKKEQAKRLDARRSDPLKRFKVSPLDGEAQKRWTDYSEARDEMLRRTDCEGAPWWCVATDHKKRARLNLMRHLLGQLGACDIEAPDHEVLFRFEPEAATDGRLAR
jgi:polyphosphate kinase 2